MTAAPTSPSTLFDRIGGQSGVRTVVAAFYGRVTDLAVHDDDVATIIATIAGLRSVVVAPPPPPGAARPGG